MIKFTPIFLLAVIGLSLAGCAGSESTSGPQNSTAAAELTVAAASDLQFAFTDIAAQFEAERGVKVNLVFGSTGLLVQQIEHGAPYDLLAAANVSFIERLAEQKLVLPDSIALYAQGRIVLANNKAGGTQALTLADLLSPEISHIAIANPEHAPYGLAAMQALQSAGVWEQLRPKLVYGENVRQALQYVQSGDAQAGIVSLSVADVPEITWRLIEADLHAPLNQALAVLTATAQPALAAEFAAYINAPAGRLIMRHYGFIMPGDAPLLPTPNQP